MKFQGEARDSRNDALGSLRRKRTSYLSGVSTRSTIEYWPLRLEPMPVGGKMILSYEALTSSEVISEPSWNLTPRRSVSEYTFWSSDTVQLTARDGTGLVPPLSFGSTRSSVL